MRRQLILGLIVVFLLVLSVLTIDDIITYGITPLSVLAIVFLGFLWPIALGVLRAPPSDDR